MAIPLTGRVHTQTEAEQRSPCMPVNVYTMCRVAVGYVTVLQEGDPADWWEETFNGHQDSKPAGPEAISIDLTFSGSQHVYGIPERTTSLALKPTAGANVSGDTCLWWLSG